MTRRLHPSGEDERLSPAAAPDEAAAAQAPRQAGLTMGDVLQLQRTAGNQAVSSALAGGLLPGAPQPEEEQEQVVGGQTLGRDVGETVGDIARPIGTGLGNLFGGAVAALTGININSSNVVAPRWDPHGDFSWDVGFTTTGTSGWIVQEVSNTYRAEDSAGTNVVPAYTPNYWEAWAVDASSAISPSVGSINDMWRRPSRGASTKGHWSMRGKCYFTTTDPATQGFASGNVPDAGILLSTTSEPSDLGIARLHRYAQGTWDSTGATPSHAGSAGP
jgi:hypothetical protein